MKTTITALCLTTILALAGCKDKNVVRPIVNNNGPVAPTTVLKTGTLTAENGTPTAGTLSLLKDANNDQWVSFNSNFTSSFATGTVTVYLAKTAARIGDQRVLPPPPTPAILAVGFVSKNGAQSLKLPAPSDPFAYVVLYCETAEINFGNARLN